MYEVTFATPWRAIEIENIGFENTVDGKYVNVTLTNMSNLSITMNEVSINNAYNWTISETIPPSETRTIGLQLNWSAAYSYQVKVVTSEGDEYIYTATAPS